MVQQCQAQQLLQIKLFCIKYTPPIPITIFKGREQLAISASISLTFEDWKEEKEIYYLIIHTQQT